MAKLFTYTTKIIHKEKNGKPENSRSRRLVYMSCSDNMVTYFLDFIKNSPLVEENAIHNRTTNYLVTSSLLV